jgi:6-phosphogluconolactonase
MTTTHVHAFADANAAGKAAGAFVANAIVEALRARGTCRIALAGGSTPRPLYRRLATEPYRSLVPWAALDIFWGDERPVAPSHADSNYAMAYESLLAHVNVDWRHVYRIEGEIDPATAAARYETTILAAFRGEPGVPRFDLVLLGLGADAHTASLFAGTHALDDGDALVAANRVSALHTTRITMTLPLLNAARRVMFFVTGTGKAAAVRSVLAPTAADAIAPAALVRPRNGRVDWILDADAAHLVQLPPGSDDPRLRAETEVVA